MPRTHVGGLTLSYEQAGSGPDVVLVHGLGASLAFWYFDAMRRLAANFRATAFDLRGHGRSDMPAAGYTTAHMAEDLHGLLDRLGIARAHLVGHSFGGAVVLHAAVLRPERVKSLTIADARVRALQPTVRFKDWTQSGEWAQRVPDLEPELDRNQEIDFRLMTRMAQRRMQRRRADADLSIHQPFHAWGGRRAAHHWLTLLSSTRAEVEFEVVAGLTPGRIARLTVPVNAVYGEYSFCLPTCWWLERNLLNATVTIVPKAGHFHPVVRPALFVDQLRRFLATQERAESMGRTAAHAARSPRAP